MNFLGIDIGGTKTAVCVGDETGAIRASDRIPSTSGEHLEAYIDRLVALCGDMVRQSSLEMRAIDAVGVSAPGPLDVKRGVLIEPPNNVGWRDVPLGAILSERLARPVSFNNDANACALAELYFGQHGVKDLLYLTCSTGMGGGVIANGELVQGITDTGGEVGHHVIDRDGPLCGCGMRGCWEAFVGGRRVAERVQEAIRAGGVRSRLTEMAGGRPEAITFKLIAQAARQGDAYAVGVWDEFVERMAQGIGNLIMILNPQVVVLGTVAIHEGDFLMVPLREKLVKYTWKWPREACRIVPSPLGGRIGDLAALAVAVGAVRAKP